jgi:hypothetical protein
MVGRISAGDVHAGRPLPREVLLWLVFAVVLAAFTIAGSELVASFFVPASPARDIRPVSAAELRANMASALIDTPDLIPVYNDWSLRDRPRTVARPAGVRFRSVFVGDSFLEGYFVTKPLTERIETLWTAGGVTDHEAINFGVTATGPLQYHYRVKDVALDLKPDVVVLALYAGNDFVATPYRRLAVPPVVAELPMPSLVGTVAPRTNWLIVNRLGLSEVGRGTKGIPGEFALLNDWAQKPPAERLGLTADFMRTHYYPSLGLDRIREILSRGDGRLWDAFKPRSKDREFAAGWIFNSVIDWESGTWEVPRDAAEADRLASGPMVEETLSWVLATRQLVEAQGRRFMAVLIPVGVGDPDYVEFWRPWPRYYSYNLSSTARLKQLSRLLRERGVRLVDLSDDLHGVAGSYRLTDGHWTEFGTDVAARRLAREVLPH